MSIAEKIWLYYGPHANRDPITGYVETSLVTSQWARVIFIAESTEGSLCIDKYMPRSAVSLTPPLWEERIDNTLLDLWHDRWKQECDLPYSERYGREISFEFEWLVAWFLTSAPKPYRVSPGALRLYADAADRI